MENSGNEKFVRLFYFRAGWKISDDEIDAIRKTVKGAGSDLTAFVERVGTEGGTPILKIRLEGQIEDRVILLERAIREALNKFSREAAAPREEYAEATVRMVVGWAMKGAVIRYVQAVALSCDVRETIETSKLAFLTYQLSVKLSGKEDSVKKAVGMIAKMDSDSRELD